MIKNTVYQFSARQFNGQEVSLDNFKNKVLLIVNIASQCGLTPQLEELRALKDDFADHNFEILAFPSNDFAGQEPLGGAELATYCDAKAPNYKVFDKIHVKGPGTHPLYNFLADKKANGVLGKRPMWNFHKFLIKPDGTVADFFYPFTKPSAGRLRKKISRLLEQK